MCRSSTSGTISATASCNSSDIEPQQHNAKEELYRTGHWFPNMPQIRKIAKVVVSGSDFQARKRDEVEVVCHKNAKNNGNLGHGVILYWCGDHSRCVGFNVLTSPESCKDVYETLSTRFKVLPKLIIYDNACHLFEYCVNRNPSLFKETKFMSDNLHWQNHTNCSTVFDPRTYKLNINTVLHESQNKRLRKLKETSPHMKYDTFVEQLLNLVHHLNLRPPLTTKAACTVGVPFYNSRLHVTSDEISVSSDDATEAI